MVRILKLSASSMNSRAICFHELMDEELNTKALLNYNGDGLYYETFRVFHVAYYTCWCIFLFILFVILFVCLFDCWFACLLARLFVCSSIRSFVRSLVRLSVVCVRCLFVGLPVCLIASLIECLFAYLLDYLFICLFGCLFKLFRCLQPPVCNRRWLPPLKSFPTEKCSHLF